jgi:PAS domain S-box-containing protein
MDVYSRPQLSQVNALSKLVHLLSHRSNIETKDSHGEVISQICSLMAADAAIFCRYDSVKQSATCMASSDPEFLFTGESYSLDKTPCAEVIKSNNVYVCSDNAYSLFPEDPALKDNAIRGYIGAPLRDQNGKVIGLTSCIFKEGIANQGEAIGFLNFIAQLLSEMLQKERLQEALKTSEEKLQKTHSVSMLCIAEINRAGKILTQNPLWQRHPFLSEHREDGTYLSTKLETTEGASIYREKKPIEALYDTKTFYQSSLVIKEKNNRRNFLLNAIGHVDTLDHATVNSLVQIQDVTQQVSQHQRLSLIQDIINSTNEAVSITDSQGNITNINPAFEKVTGYKAAEIIGKNPRILQSGKHGPRFYKNMWLAIKTLGYWEGEIWNKRKDGQLFPEHIAIRKITDDKGETTNYISVFEDQTLKYKMNEKIAELTEKDPETGLPNKQKTLERLENIITSGNQFFLLFLFLDIKEKDPEHRANKALLENIAAILNIYYGHEIFIGAISSREFTVILTEGDAQTLPELIKKLSRAILSNNNLHLRQSGIGAIMSNSQIKDALEYIALGKEAAKHAGSSIERTKILDNISIHHMKKQRKIEDDLLHALAEKEIYSAYEPLIDLVDNRVIGAEALARWQHPTMGMVPPSSFLAAAYRTGLFNNTTKILLNDACNSMKSWINAGYKLDRLSVNVAAQQIDLMYLPELMETALKTSGLDSRYLQIEVTEDALIDKSQSPEVLKKIKEMGIRISIDDFGTGYSSLSYLKELPADTLKIDRSFICEAHKNIKDIAIITSIISLAKNLGMEVIAEGIENEKQRDLLIDLGCDIGQGHYYSKAKKEDQFKVLLSSYNNNE